MVVSLITEANKGLGYETARRLVAAGHEVWIGSPDLDRGWRAANELGAQAEQLEVTDDTSGWRCRVPTHAPGRSRGLVGVLPW